MLKKAFCCSPYRENSECKFIERENFHKDLASALGRFVALEEGYLPIVPHVFFTRMLDDDAKDERLLGIRMGLHLLLECRKLYFVTCCKITDGMLREIVMAVESGLEIIECDFKATESFIIITRKKIINSGRCDDYRK